MRRLSKSIFQSCACLVKEKEKEAEKEASGYGSGGQLCCRLMLLTVDLFIQASGCLSLSPGLGRRDALHDVVPWGGTTSITAAARPLVQRQREAELRPPGCLTPPQFPSKSVQTHVVKASD